MKAKTGKEQAVSQQEAPKKEDRRVRRTKRILTQALTQLLQEKQVKDITVKELTERADINRGTFYLYYKDVFDMLEKTEDNLFLALDEIVSLHEDKDVKSQLGAILEDLFLFIADNQDVCSVLLSPNGDISFLQRLYTLLHEKVLHYWQAEQPVSSRADFDYRYSFVVYGIAGIIRSWVTRNCPECPKEMAALAEDMIFSNTLPG